MTRLTSYLGASAAGVVVLAVIASTVAVHGMQPSRIPVSSALIAKAPVVVRAGHLAVAHIATAAPAAGTKPVAQAPSYNSPVYRAPYSIVIGSTQQALINRDRASAGLGPLTWNSCLASVAVSNAVRLSRQGWVPPYHTNGPQLDLGCRLGNQAGENVGYWSGGINDGQLNTMFMNSPEHRANIMGPYHYVGTAWAIGAGGAAYIAVEFS